MKGSFEYGLTARFYGLFSQLPWSLVITAIILLPIAYNADRATQILITQLTIYWALIMGAVFLVKDIGMQRKLHKFSIQGRKILVYKKGNAAQEYYWDELVSIKSFSKKDSLARRMLESEGVVLKFKDGFELPVFNKVTNFELFSVMLKKMAM